MKRDGDNAPPKIRLHLDAALAPGQTIALEREAANYLFNVMRLVPADALRVFNSRDGEFRAQVSEAKKRAGALIMREQLRPAAPPPDVWLLFAPIKKARTDFIVEKACELGARRIAPVLTKRTNAERVNTERLRAHVIEAAEQCELVFVPELAPPAPLDHALAQFPTGRRLYFCDEARDARPLHEAVEPGPAALLIGPEGGFAPEETAQLRALEFVTPVSLGPRILRADTAAAAALALWQSRAGDFK